MHFYPLFFLLIFCLCLNRKYVLIELSIVFVFCFFPIPYAFIVNLKCFDSIYLFVAALYIQNLLNLKKRIVKRLALLRSQNKISAPPNDTNRCTEESILVWRQILGQDSRFSPQANSEWWKCLR